MSSFHRMTIVAATEVLAAYKTHDELAVLDVEWDLAGRTDAGNKSGRVAALSKIAIEENPTVRTVNGESDLDRAIIDLAILAPPKEKSSASWKKLVAGLHFDGFEITEEDELAPDERPWQMSRRRILALRRMLPADVPGTDFREAEAEVYAILGRHGLTTSAGHLRQSMAAFSRGEWSSANGELRNFYEDYLNQIAIALGCDPTIESKDKRDYLGRLTPPFLLVDYNEWDAQKPKFAQALLTRMHPHGGHPGLSEEDDATFRLQISLITARLFLRRFDTRMTGFV